MKSDCQGEDFESLEPLTYEDLSEALRYALDRCVDKVRDGVTLPREDINGCDCYAYRAGDKIARGVNGQLGYNIFRDQVEG